MQGCTTPFTDWLVLRDTVHQSTTLEFVSLMPVARTSVKLPYKYTRTCPIMQAGTARVLGFDPSMHMALMLAIPAANGAGTHPRGMV